MCDFSEQSVASGFDRVDSLRDTAALIDYLDAQSASDFWRKLKGESLFALALARGHSALDVGCGLGDEVRAMAAIVGARGRAIGIDSSHRLIDEAVAGINSSHRLIDEARARTGSNCPAEFTVGDARHLPFDDDTFDAIRVERTLQHTECPFDVIAQMFRVTKPGAKVIAIEPDWDTLVIAAAPLAVGRIVCRRWADRIRHPAVGRELLSMFHQVGFYNIVVHPCTSLITDCAFADQQFEIKHIVRAAVAENEIDQAVAISWLDDLQSRDEAGRFVAAVTYFVISGQKPPTSTSSMSIPV